MIVHATAFSSRSGWQGLTIFFNLPRVPLTLHPRLVQTSPLWGSTAPFHRLANREGQTPEGAPSRPYGPALTAISIGRLATPPILIWMAARPPVGSTSGSWMFSCASPTNPAVKPVNKTFARLRPTRTATGAFATEIGDAEAASPVAGGFVTLPRPVKNITTISPGLAGDSGVTNEPSA